MTEAPKEQPLRQIKISLLPNGNVVVEAPFDDKILCYGLLEVAREQVANFKSKQLIQPVGAIPTVLPAGRNGG
jgi:hypothetical protein